MPMLSPVEGTPPRPPAQGVDFLMCFWIVSIYGLSVGVDAANNQFLGTYPRMSEIRTTTALDANLN